MYMQCIYNAYVLYAMIILHWLELYSQMHYAILEGRIYGFYCLYTLDIMHLTTDYITDTQ